MMGHGDVLMSVGAMKAGAVEFLAKLFRDQDMLDAVAQAIERDRKRRDSEKSLAELRGLFDSLTTRGREDHGVFHDWVDEEAGGDGPQAQRNHGQVPSRPRYEEEGRAILGGPREGRRSPRTA
jgi:hypothetical protein